MSPGEWCRVRWKGGGQFWAAAAAALYYVAQVGNSAGNNQCLDSATFNRWTPREKIKKVSNIAGYFFQMCNIFLGLEIALQVCFRKQKQKKKETDTKVWSAFNSDIH